MLNAALHQRGQVLNTQPCIAPQRGMVQLFGQLRHIQCGFRCSQTLRCRPHTARQQPSPAPKLRGQIAAAKAKPRLQQPPDMGHVVDHLLHWSSHPYPAKLDRAKAPFNPKLAARLDRALRLGYPNGMLAQIYHPASGPITAPPLLIAHGLFGSGRNWGVIARRLADCRDVIAVDMRNHGSSPRKPSHTYPDLAADLANVITALGQPIDLLGHSMGGKAAMQLALTQDQFGGDLLRRLIVADIAPIAYNHDQTRHIEAMQTLDLQDISSRAAADARLEPLVTDPALRAFFLQSLDLKTNPSTWKLNLSVLADQMHNIIGWPGTLGRFDGPALFLTGANSHYVQPQHRAQIQNLFPKARFAKLAGAGHWLHAEKPREFEETVRLFLAA